MSPRELKILEKVSMIMWVFIIFLLVKNSIAVKHDGAVSYDSTGCQEEEGRGGRGATPQFSGSAIAFLSVNFLL